jgi:integrase
MNRIKGKPHYYRKEINGRFYDYYVRRTTIDGKYRTISAKTFKQWEEKVEKMKKDIDSGMDQIHEANASIKDLAPKYLKDSEEFASSTYLRRKQFLNKYIVPEFREKKLKDIRNADVKIFYNRILEEKGLSILIEIHRVLNTFFKFCMENEYAIMKNPINEGLLSSIKRKVRRTEIDNAVKKEDLELDREQISYILREVKGTPEEVIYHFQILHGLRISEALAMRFENIDLKENTLEVKEQVKTINKTQMKGTKWENNDYNSIEAPKTTNSNRIIPLQPPTRELLNKLIEKNGSDKGLIYKTREGKVCSAQNWTKSHHKPLMKKFGLSVKNHSLRKFFGSFYISEGTPIQIVSKWLGHAKISTTLEHYAKVIKQVEHQDKWKISEIAF